YGPFKFGDALTPLCVNAMLVAAPERQESIGMAARYLKSFVSNNATIEEPKFGFEFAAYISALAVTTLSHPSLTEFCKEGDAWLNYLRSRQLTEDLGWEKKDKEYGGWGYCRVQPRKPEPGELVVPLLESNLSATTYALAAFQAAGVTRDDPLYSRARLFVQ